jgi:FkbM family methyltransferase
MTPNMSENIPKKVFLDMGSHRQQGLSEFKQILHLDGSWEIHSFEPNPAIEPTVFSTTCDLNITKHKKAIWIKNGVVKFNQYGERGESQGSLVVDTGGGSHYADYTSTVEVDCIDVYEFIKKLPSDSEIYIKMDIEYSEYPVLEYILDKGWFLNIKEIWVEWHGMFESEFISRKKSILEKLALFGLEINGWK